MNRPYREEEEDEGCEGGVASRGVHMPPPMHPINIRSLLGMGQHNGNTGEAYYLREIKLENIVIFF